MPKWLKWLWLPLALTLGAWALFSWVAAQRDEAWERIQQTKVLAVVTDASYPPFAAISIEGEAFGFDIDLANEIGRRWGVRVAIENLTYDALPGALIVNRDDMVISAFVPQPERTRDLAYTRPYFVNGTTLVLPTTAPLVGDDPIAWAANQTIAVEYGATGDALARDWARHAPNVTLQPYDTVEEALQAVADGTATAALVDLITASAYLHDHPTLHRAGPLLEPEPYVIVVNARSQTLLRELEKTLEEMEGDGTLERLREKWVGK